MFPPDSGTIELVVHRECAQPAPPRDIVERANESALKVRGIPDMSNVARHGRGRLVKAEARWKSVCSFWSVFRR